MLLIDADAQANLTMVLGYNRPDDLTVTRSTVMQNIVNYVNERAGSKAYAQSQEFSVNKLMLMALEEYRKNHG